MVRYEHVDQPQESRRRKPRTAFQADRVLDAAEIFEETMADLAGVAMVRESLSIWILRAVTGSSLRRSKRVASLAYLTVAAMARSSSLAAMASVSSVM